jgi:nitroimidazol reductase NimA-like FMN-containing flavoprotein (pyridoxamine 5'-phosphate oxidase superfamily)
MAKKSKETIPPKVMQVLRKSGIGYLSVTSPKGDLYSYPVAFYFSGDNVYFVTPTGSAKFRFIKANPKVSMVVDNRDLSTEACGAMIQGEATIYNMGQMAKSLVSVVSTAKGLSDKYPGMFTFYATGKDLPDERKIYKYRFIRIKPTKILYWVGYKFGRYIAKSDRSRGRLKQLFADLRRDGNEGENALEAIAGMIEGQEESPEDEETILAEEPWLRRLEKATSTGGVSDDEKRLLEMFTQSPSLKAPEMDYSPPTSAEVTDEEKSILKRWKDSQPDS